MKVVAIPVSIALRLLRLFDTGESHLLGQFRGVEPLGLVLAEEGPAGDYEEGREGTGSQDNEDSELELIVVLSNEEANHLS